MATLTRSLLQLQAAFGLLATLGMVTMMGFNPIYAVVPVLHAVGLIVLGTLIVRRYRRAVVIALVLEVLAVAGWLLQFVVGLIPELDFTVNLTGLLTTLLLPLTVLVLCARLLCADRAVVASSSAVVAPIVAPSDTVAAPSGVALSGSVVASSGPVVALDRWEVPA